MIWRAFNSRRESGVVLFMTLIFLVLLTVMALTTFTVSKGTQQVVANMTSRNLTFSIANQASENAISSVKVDTSPTTPLLDPVTGAYVSSIVVDVNGDGKTQINASIPSGGAASCFSAAQVASNALVLPRDLKCANAIQLNLHCYDVNFAFTTLATDAVTNSTTSVTQGASSRATPAQAQNICHGPAGEVYLN